MVREIYAIPIDELIRHVAPRGHLEGKRCRRSKEDLIDVIGLRTGHFAACIGQASFVEELFNER